MKYVKSAVWVTLSAIAVLFLTSVYHEYQIVGLITINEEGQNIGILNSSNYPLSWHLYIGASIAIIFYAIRFFYNSFLKSEK